MNLGLLVAVYDGDTIHSSCLDNIESYLDAHVHEERNDYILIVKVVSLIRQTGRFLLNQDLNSIIAAALVSLYLIFQYAFSFHLNLSYRTMSSTHGTHERNHHSQR